MKRSLSYLISLVLFFGCTTTDTNGLGDPKIGIAVSKRNYSDWEASDGKISKDYYCTGTRPKRKVESKILLSIPKPLTSMAPDEYQRRRSEYIERARRYVKGFYWLSSRYGESTANWNRTFYLAKQQGKAFEEKMLDARSVNDWNEYRPLLFVNRPDTQIVELLPRRYFQVDGHGAANTITWRLIESSSLESTAIVERFSALIPYETQKQFFPEGRYSGDYGVTDLRQQMSGEFVGLDGNRKPSIESALKGRTGLWMAMIPAMTNVKESSVDSDHIKFDVTLDLSTFCNFAQPIENLTAK